MTPLISLGLVVSRYLKALAAQPQQPIDYRAQALKLNQLAAGIHSVADARMLVDFVAEIFSDKLPPDLVTSSMRERVAEAEFAAVNTPHKLISEQGVAEAWNAYARTIGAPSDSQVSAAEIHNLRDGFLTIANLYWKRGHYIIWTVPAIYAAKDDGTLAEGCRAIEAIRIFQDLADMPDNLVAARARVSQGVLASDQFRQTEERPSSTTSGSYVSFRVTPPNPIEVAERQYVAKNGIRALVKAVNTMLNQALG
jgi:hypothetical protein